MKQQGKNRIVSLLFVFCISSIVVMLVVLSTPKEKTGEFIPPKFDATAQVGTPNVSEDLGWSELDA